MLYQTLIFLAFIFLFLPKEYLKINEKFYGDLYFTSVVAIILHIVRALVLCLKDESWSHFAVLGGLIISFQILNEFRDTKSNWKIPFFAAFLIFGFLSLVCEILKCKIYVEW